MGFYRKKPVVIEAFQHEKDARWPQWFMDKWNAVPAEAYTDAKTGDLVIITLEGEMTARLGDWIIKGVEGELYPCKPGIFKATYKRVYEDETPTPAKEGS